MHIILGPPRSGIKLLEDCLGLLGFSSIEDNAGMNAKTVNKLLLQDIGLSPDFSGALPQDWMNYRAAAEARNRINKLLKSMPGFSQSAVLQRTTFSIVIPGRSIFLPQPAALASGFSGDEH